MSRPTLKAYFQTTDIPSEAQFAELIDESMNNVDDLATQGEAEAGTSTVPKVWTPQRIAQAITAQGVGGLYNLPSGTLSDFVTAAGATPTPLGIKSQMTVTSGTLIIPLTIDTSIAGNGTIDVSSGATVEIHGDFKAPRDKQVFTGAGTVLFREGSVDKVNARWFGAIPDAFAPVGTSVLSTSGTDSSVAINKAIAAADDVQMVYLPGGKIESGPDINKPGYYKLDGPIQMGAAATFKTYKLIGDQGGGGSFRSRLFNNTVLGGAIDIQSTRGALVKNFSILGLNAAGRSLVGLNQYKTLSNWFSPGINTGQYTVNSAIRIDPDQAAVGSAETVIENVDIQNHVLPLNISAGGQVQGDTVYAKDCTTDYCPYGYSSGNPQNRACKIEGGNFKRGHTFFVNDTFGDMGGSGINVGGAAQITSFYQLIKGTTAFGETIDFDGWFGENIGRIGLCLGGNNENPVNFSNFTLKLAPDVFESETKAFEGQTKLSFSVGTISMSGFYLFVVDNDRTTSFDTISFKFAGANVPRILPHTISNNGVMRFINSTASSNTGVVEDLDNVKKVAAADADSVQDLEWYHQMIRIIGSSQDGSEQSIIRTRSVSTTGSITVTTFPGGEIEYTIPGGVQQYTIGDIINGRDADGLVLPVLEITATNIGANTITAAKIWHNVQDSDTVGNASGFIKHRLTTQKKYGVVTKGSDLIQGIPSADTLFAVGQVWPVQGFNKGANPRIVSFPNAVTVQLSEVALFSVPKVEFKDAYVWNGTEPEANIIPNYVDPRIKAVGHPTKCVWAFDDGYKNVVTNALPLFLELGHRFTVFHETEHTGVSGLGVGADRDYLDSPDLRLLDDSGMQVTPHFFADPTDTEQVLYDDALAEMVLLRQQFTGEKVPTGTTGSFTDGPITHPQYSNLPFTAMSYRGGTRSAKTTKVMRMLFDSISSINGLIDEKGLERKTITEEYGFNQVQTREPFDTTVKNMDAIKAYLSGLAGSNQIGEVYAHGVVDGNLDPSTFSFPALNEVELKEILRFAFDNNIQFVPVNYARKGSLIDEPSDASEQYIFSPEGAGNTITVDAVETYLGRANSIRMHVEVGEEQLNNSHQVRTNIIPLTPWSEYELIVVGRAVGIGSVGSTLEGVNMWLQTSSGDTANTTIGSHELQDQIQDEAHKLFTDGLPNVDQGWVEYRSRFINTSGTQGDIRISMFGVNGDFYFDPRIHLRRVRSIKEMGFKMNGVFKQGVAGGYTLPIPRINKGRSVAGGTVSVTAGTALVTGVGTTFTSFDEGTPIEINTEDHIIKSVTSDTSMVLYKNHVAGASAEPYYLVFDSGKWKIEIGAEPITPTVIAEHWIDDNGNTQPTLIASFAGYPDGTKIIKANGFILEVQSGVLVSTGGETGFMSPRTFLQVNQTDSGAAQVERYFIRFVKNVAADKDLYPFPQHSTSNRQIYGNPLPQNTLFLPWNPVITGDGGGDPGRGGLIGIEEDIDMTNRPFTAIVSPIISD